MFLLRDAQFMHVCFTVIAAMCTNYYNTTGLIRLRSREATPPNNFLSSHLTTEYIHPHRSLMVGKHMDTRNPSLQIIILSHFYFLMFPGSIMSSSSLSRWKTLVQKNSRLHIFNKMVNKHRLIEITDITNWRDGVVVESWWANTGHSSFAPIGIYS